MNNDELRELVRLLLMCGIMDKTATESGNVTDEEWLRMKTLIEKYQAEGGINCEPDKSGDLISRSYLKNLPFERVIHTDFGDTAIPIEEIDNAPTVEIPTELCKGCRFLKDCETCEEKLRPQGEWIERSNRYDSYSHRMVFKCECNQCQMCEEFPQDDETGNILLSHYCPNCGADMWKV